ncbi:hypothetical protein U1Q18_001237 [Sarracenia purpurea var. burkii]
MELAAARAAQESILSGSPLSEDLKKTDSSGKRRYFMVVGINTAFSSRRRRDSIRSTWMPQGSWIAPLLSFPPNDLDLFVLFWLLVWRRYLMNFFQQKLGKKVIEERSWRKKKVSLYALSLVIGTGLIFYTSFNYN